MKQVSLVAEPFSLWSWSQLHHCERPYCLPHGVLGLPLGAAAGVPGTGRVPGRCRCRMWLWQGFPPLAPFLRTGSSDTVEVLFVWDF